MKTTNNINEGKIFPQNSIKQDGLYCPKCGKKIEQCICGKKRPLRD
jgi:hypothetical protein